MVDEISPHVWSALDLAARLAFAHSCTMETGRLLAVLAATARNGTIGEIGTGCGVAAAWIASSYHSYLSASAGYTRAACQAGRYVVSSEAT